MERSVDASLYRFKKTITLKELSDSFTIRDGSYLYSGYNFDTSGAYFNDDEQHKPSYADSDSTLFWCPILSEYQFVYVYHVDFYDIEITIYYGLVELVGENTSEDCPFSYELYVYSFIGILDNETYYHDKLKISKADVVVYDERIYNEEDYNSAYAESIMQTYIDDCENGLKIKTDCCILVCCEPDKYELI